MEQIIKKAIEGGWDANSYYEKDGWKLSGSDTLLDPLFWQALGKACGWEGEDTNYTTHRMGLHSDDKPYVGEPECDCNRPKTWKTHALRFYEINLTQGMDEAIKYLKEITK